MSSTLSPNPRMNEIGVRCSGTRKCSQRYAINNFCQGYFAAIQPSEAPPKIRPEIPLEISLEMHLEIPLEIPTEIPLEVSLEIHLEIPPEIPPEIRPEILFEIPHRSKTHPQTPYQASAWSYR